MSKVMARLVFVALMWGAVHGEEYGGGNMPQYGGAAADYAEPAAAVASADYTEHSPDAAAPLDYKYMEDRPASRERIHKDVYSTNGWEQRMNDRRSRHDNDELDVVDSEIAVSKHKSSRRLRHRSRKKSEKPREPRRRRSRINTGNEDNDERREYIRSNDYKDEMKSEAENEVHTSIQQSTERVIRRKVRERHFVPLPSKPNDMESDREVREPVRKMKDIDSEEEALQPLRNIKDDFKSEPEYNIEQPRKRIGRPPRPPQPSFEDDDDDIDSDVDLSKKSSGRQKYDKSYPEYHNYYDMDRVYNIKNRLPMLLRRTTTRIPTLEEDIAATPDLIKMLWTARRAASPSTIVLQTTTTTTTTTTDRPATTTTTSATTSKSAVIPLASSSTTRAPTFTDLESQKSTELSLAEKSRLSILKKAQRKESDKPAHSTKPPVLLQVASKVPTIVMVEASRKPDPWIGAREISGDSPHRLEKVKHLMRQKLVAEAKDMKDLTENWDEMICDYIDTSLLDSWACDMKVDSLLLIVCYVLCHLTWKIV